MSDLIFVAPDGSFGSADGLVIISATDVPEDFADLSDFERYRIAVVALTGS